MRLALGRAGLRAVEEYAQGVGRGPRETFPEFQGGHAFNDKCGRKPGDVYRRFAFSWFEEFKFTFEPIPFWAAEVKLLGGEGHYS